MYCNCCSLRKKCTSHEEFEICAITMLTPLCWKVYFVTPWWGQCNKHQWLREQTVPDVLLYIMIFFVINQLKSRIKDWVINTNTYVHSMDPWDCHKTTVCGTCRNTHKHIIKHTNIKKYYSVKYTFYTVVQVSNIYHLYMQNIHPQSKRSVHIKIFSRLF